MLLSVEMLKKLLYRFGVGIVVVNKERKVLIARRIDLPEVWQFPQGGIEADEEIIAAAKRELYEEVGIKDIKVLQVADELITYDFPPELRKKYLGQKHRWVMVEFLGDDKEISFDKGDKPEFSDFRWVEFRQAVAMMTGFKKPAYQKIYELFGGVI